MAHTGGPPHGPVVPPFDPNRPGGILPADPGGAAPPATGPYDPSRPGGILPADPTPIGPGGGPGSGFPSPTPNPGSGGPAGGGGSGQGGQGEGGSEPDTYTPAQQYAHALQMSWMYKYNDDFRIFIDGWIAKLQDPLFEYNSQTVNALFVADLESQPWYKETVDGTGLTEEWWAAEEYKTKNPAAWRAAVATEMASIKLVINGQGYSISDADLRRYAEDSLHAAGANIGDPDSGFTDNEVIRMFFEMLDDRGLGDLAPDFTIPTGGVVGVGGIKSVSQQLQNYANNQLVGNKFNPGWYSDKAKEIAMGNLTLQQVKDMIASRAEITYDFMPHDLWANLRDSGQTISDQLYDTKAEVANMWGWDIDSLSFMNHNFFKDNLIVTDDKGERSFLQPEEAARRAQKWVDENGESPYKKTKAYKEGEATFRTDMLQMFGYI